MYSIELGQDKKPIICDCCGGEINSAVGFIYKDKDAFSIYQASWSKAHSEAVIDFALNFAKDGDFENTKNVFAVGLIVVPTEQKYQCSFVDPDKSTWKESNLRDKMFTKEEALLHPQKSEFFRIIEFVIANDFRIKDALG